MMFSDFLAWQLVPDTAPGWIVLLCSIIADWTVLSLVRMFETLTAPKISKEIMELRMKMESINPKENFKEYALTQRRLKALEKAAPGHKPKTDHPWLNMLRNSVPPLLFRNLKICDFPSKFWTPISKAVSFPHHSTDSSTAVGFCFAWVVICAADSSIMRMIQ